MTQKALVWAHRGASGYLPENTLPAFQKAADMKADGVELDIQLTKDDRIVVIHDEKIDRTSYDKGWIKDFTLEQLKGFDFSRTFPAYGRAQIPLMSEVLDLLKPTDLTINIELKTGLIFYKDIEGKILKLVHDYGMEDRIIYSSFNHYSVTTIKTLDPSARTAFLYADGFIDMPDYGAAHNVNALHPDYHNLQYPGLIEGCRAHHLDLNVWTVNDPEDIRKCAEAGVHAVITNYPDKAREIIDAL
jgi:glycerophosphoryl diester phosphodiesterase